MRRRALRAFALGFLVKAAYGQPALVPFTDCTSAATRSASNYDPNERINISSVFGQIAYPDGQKTLRLNLIAVTGEQVIPSETDSTGDLILSTLFTRTSVLTFTLNQTSSWFCETVRPPSPLPALNTTTNTYCPIPAGQLAWSVDNPLYHDYNLTSIITRVRIVDPSEPGRELTCVDVWATPVRPDQSKTKNPGYPQMLFWLSVGLVMGYWLVIGAARISNAWSRGIATGPGWSSVRWAGTVFASAVSAERLSTHSALLRFATPSWRDVMYHTQWCAALAMIAVQWPTFAYPILSNAAWATLIYNITIIADSNKAVYHWSPWASNYSAPSRFADQFADPNSPLFLDPTIPNNLYGFPDATASGMASFAYAVGVRPQDLFGICLKIWLVIVGAAVIVSVSIWFIDWCVSSCMKGGRRRGAGRASINDLSQYTLDGGGPGGSGKESSDLAVLRTDDEMGGLPRSLTATHLGIRRRWWNYRLGQSSFHGSVLQGNLVRLLILFHFPITVFSTYEFSRSTPKAEAPSLVLAVLAFGLISVIIPALLITKLALSPTKKLYDATRTLLALGPLYSHYAHGAQMFAAVGMFHSLAVGIVVGAGQGSGTVQAIVMLVIEVASALATSIWLPWGERASMGILSFLFCVARIVTVVLLIILSPLVSVGDAAGGWIAYAVILIQGLVFLTFLLMLLVKISEGFVRLFGRVPFDKATHSMDSGLLGALSQAGCCGLRKARKRRGGKGGRPSHSRTATPAGGGALIADPTAVPTGQVQHAPNNSLGARPVYTSGESSYRSSPSSAAQQSFLRPEQAYQPYREDADDESGFIMGAWAGSGYQPIDTYEAGPSAAAATSTPTSSVKPSGFSRVGGGRARFDDPFATLPPGTTSAAAKAGVGHARETPNTYPRSDSAPLPPEGMAFTSPSASKGYSHSRIASHAAIIENALPLVPPRTFGAGVIEDDSSASTASGKKNGRKGGGFWQRRTASSPANRGYSFDDEYAGSGSGRGPGASGGGAGGKSWFGRLLNRPDPGSAEDDQDPSKPSATEPVTGGSSFVVVRKQRPSASSTPKDVAPQPAVIEPEAPKSFVVVRPKRASPPASSTLSPHSPAAK